MLGRTVGLWVGILVLAAASAGRARAYRTAADLPEHAGTDRVVWRTDLISLEVDTAVPMGVDIEELLAATRAAAAEWNAVACAELELQAELADGSATFADDRNTITVVEGWAGRGFDPTAGATTDIRFVEDGSGWFIREADIYLNADRLAFGDTESIRSVLLHELGHVLGLLHPCEGDCGATHQDSALFPESLGVVTVSEDDAAGVCFLYTAAPTCPATCPRGELCREGACVPAETCASNRECVSGHCVEGRCAAVGPELGDPCASNDDCATGLCAGAGYCTTPCEGSCPDGLDCQAGFCEVDQLPYGESCSAPRQCHSGLCVVGKDNDMCTRRCTDSCPAGDQCMEVDGDMVCASPSGGGCAAGGPPSTWWVAFLFLLWRRR